MVSLWITYYILCDTITVLNFKKGTGKMLKAINITKKFGALAAVDDLSFEVEEGQVFGIAGNPVCRSTADTLQE